MLKTDTKTFLLFIILMIPNHSWSQFEEFSRGNERIYLPSDYTDSTSYPLVILLHAYGMNSDTAELIWGFSQSVDEYQFIYAIPSGTADRSNSYFWNSNTACCNFYNSTVDDVSYLYQYIESLKESFNVNNNRIYIVGDSNGGFMALEFAYRFPSQIAAAVSSAGATHFYSRNDPDTGVHILQIQGTDDTSILYSGGSIQGMPYPGAVATALQWVEYNNCLISSSLEERRDLDPAIPGAETKVTLYSRGCKSGASVELWTVEKGGHGLGRPVSESSRLQLLDWLLGKAKTGWPSEFNGTIPPAGLELNLNNIGIYNEIESLIYSCLELKNYGDAYFFEETSRFDVSFMITDAMAGKIGLFNYRPFNPENVLNKNLELPDCSGNLEISSGIYSDIIKVEENFYELQFQLVSPEASEFRLFFIKEIFAVNI